MYFLDDMRCQIYPARREKKKKVRRTYVVLWSDNSRFFTYLESLKSDLDILLKSWQEQRIISFLHWDFTIDFPPHRDRHSDPEVIDKYVTSHVQSKIIELNFWLLNEKNRISSLHQIISAE